ncbi:radical SAM protein [Candidatus Woesearchaeota archaeon]|nr:radical SAM protein [Candidatus Woesearchaeota archaeon]
MKILMIGFNIQTSIFPLGLNYLKSYAKKFHPDINFKIQEFAFGNKLNHDINKNLELQVISYILVEKPDAVCFSTYIWSAELVRTICLSLKKISSIKIILGGPEIDNSYFDFADYLVIGDGEEKFVDVLDNLTNSKTNHSLVNLDDIPFPYRFHEGPKDYAAIRIETARGCPFTCAYCNYASRAYKEFSLLYLEENIKYLFENYTFRNLTILDANFNLKKNRMKDVLGIISRYSKDHKINFELKPELIDEDVIKIIKDSKLNIFCELGLQSISESVLHDTTRSYDLEKVKNGLDLLNKNNIPYKIDLMYGLPKDNFFRFLRTINFIKKYSRQKGVPAHHYMLLNNTSNSNCVRMFENNSSMVIKTDTQDVLDLYKQKLFIDLINKK